jgi:hypothetical protein
MSAMVIANFPELLGLSRLLGRCPDDSARKRLVMAAHAEQALGDAETELLISALMLEAA